MPLTHTLKHAPNASSFVQLSLNPALLTNLDSLGYQEMTPIQAQSLPSLLAGVDVIAKAHTGSGKTAAFGLTLLNQINLGFFAVQALVLCPTRELAEQVSQVIRQLARLMPNVKIVTLAGGAPMRAQMDSLKHGAHIVVGTPGRIQKHLDLNSLQLNKLNIVVLDEADRMLDMGFLDAIRAILHFCPKKRQTLLFSATYPEQIQQISHEFMQNPREIFIEKTDIEEHIEQQFYEVNPNDKFAVLAALLNQYQPKSTLIFCNTKLCTNDVATRLKREGFSAMALNGDMEQIERDLAIIQFTNHSCSIIVATDVAARGLDIKELPLVINYELAFESDIHTHRVGRTGRAGNKGLVITLTTTADASRLCAIEDMQSQPLTWLKSVTIPESHRALYQPDMTTISLNAGKKDKIRAGDILGALAKDAGITNTSIGKIDVLPQKSFVAIHKHQAHDALRYFKHGKIKGRSIIARKY